MTTRRASHEPKRTRPWSALAWGGVLVGLTLLGSLALQRAEPPTPRMPALPASPTTAAPGTEGAATATTPRSGVPPLAAPAAPATAEAARTSAAPTTAETGSSSAPVPAASATAVVPVASPAPPGPASTPNASTPIDPLPDDSARLRQRQLSVPVQGVTRAQLVDSFSQARAGGARRHDAIDILAAQGTPVLAVEDGRIARLFFSHGGGGITVYQFDPGERYAYYYAHLARYADGLKEGQPVRRGQVIGYVGASGNAQADAPHLHFAITRLEPDKAWWKGEALNPYPVLQSGP